MGRARQQPAAIAGATDRFAGAVGNRRGVPNATLVQEASRRGSPQELMSALGGMQPQEADMVLEHMRRLLAQDPHNHRLLFAAVAHHQQWQDEKWASWRGKLDDLLASLHVQYMPHPDYVLGHLAGGYDEFPGLTEVVEVGLRWQEGGQDRLDDQEGLDALAAHLVQALRAFPDPGPDLDRSEIDDRLVRFAYSQLEMVMNEDTDVARWVIQDVLTNTPASGRNSRLYLVARAKLISEQPSAENNNRHDQLISVVLSQDRDGDGGSDGADPDLVEAMRASLPQQVSSIPARYNQLLRLDDVPLVISEAAAHQLSEMLRAIDEDMGTDQENQRFGGSSWRNKNRLDFQTSLADAGEAVRNSPGGRELAQTLADSEANVYVHTLQDLFDPYGKRAEEQETQIETIRVQASATMKELLETGRTDVLSTPQSQTRQAMLEPVIELAVASSIGNGYQRFMNTAITATFTPEDHEQLQTMTQDEWHDIWQFTILRDWMPASSGSRIPSENFLALSSARRLVAQEMNLRLTAIKKTRDAAPGDVIDLTDLPR